MKSRIGRWIARLGAALTCAIVFIAALILGVFVHIDLPLTRKALEVKLNDALSGIRPDHCRIEGLSRTGLDGFELDAIECSIAGVGHFRVEGIAARLPVVENVMRLLRQPAQLALLVRTIHAERADLSLRLGARPPGEGDREPSSPPRFELSVDRVWVDHLKVRGPLEGTPEPLHNVEADIDGLSTGVRLSLVTQMFAWDRAAAKAEVRGLLPVPIALAPHSSGRLPLSDDGPALDIRVGGHVRAANVTAALEAHAEGRDLHARVRVPPAPTDAIRKLLNALQAPDLDLRGPVAIDASASGTFPDLTGRIEVEALEGSVAAEGTVHWREPFSLEAKVAGKRINLGQVRSADLPRTRLAFDGRLAASLRSADAPDESMLSRLTGEAALHLHPGIIGDVAIPASRIDLRTARGEVRAMARVNQRGARLRLEATRRPDGDIQFRAEGEMQSHGRADARAAGVLPLAGRAILYVDGSLEKGQLRVASQIRADHLRLAQAREAEAGCAQERSSTDTRTTPFAVDHLRLSARAEGPLAAWSQTLAGMSGARPAARAPKVWLDGSSQGLCMGGYRWTDASLRARGTTSDLAIRAHARQLETASELEVACTIAGLGARTEVTGLSVRATRYGRAVWGAARKLTFDAGELEVADLVLRGLGEPIEIDARAGGQSGWQVRVHAPRVQLREVAGFVWSERGLTGSAALELFMERGNDAENGRTTGSLRVESAQIHGWPAIDGQVDVSIVGPNAQIAGAMQSEGIGRIRLEATPKLVGPITEPSTWSRIAGHAAMEVEALHLNSLCAWAKCRASIDSLVFAIETTIRGRIDVTRGAPPSSDAAAPASVAIDIAGDLLDRSGVLVTGHVQTEVDLARAIELRSIPLDTSLDAHVVLFRRRLAELPISVRPATLRGALDADVSGSGTLGRPRVVMHVHGYDLEHIGVAPRSTSPALGLELTSTYDGARVQTDATLRTASAEVMRLRGLIEAPVEDWIGPKATRTRWSAGFAASAQDLPLASFPPIADRGVAGLLTGHVAVFGLNEQPVAAAELDLANVSVESDELDHAHVSLDAGASACSASLNLGHPGAEADLRVRLGCSWRHDLVPEIDGDQLLTATFVAHQFPLEGLRPFLGRSGSRLAGRVEGTLTVQGHPDLKHNDLTAQGALDVSGGRMLILPLGRELRHVHLRLTADGRGGVRVEDLRGRLGSGSFSGKVEAELRGLELERARAELHVPSGQGIPVTVEGVSYGTAWGDVTIDAHVKGRDLLADVKVPTLRLQMPSQSTARLESLEDNPNIDVLQPLGPEPEEAEDEPRTARVDWPIERLVATIQLGSDVGVRRDQMRLDITTPPPPQGPRLVIGRPSPDEPSTMTLDGTVRLLGGTVPVAGRTFRIDRGLVRFGGEEFVNPSLDIDAQTDAPDGTHVMVHVGGTLASMDLTLTSQPPKPQNELLALLAFGQTSPGSAQGRYVGGGPSLLGGLPARGGGTGAGIGGAGAGGHTSAPGSSVALGAAAGLGAGFLSSGINQLLARSAFPIQTTVRSAGATSAAASFQLTERLRLEYIRQFGASRYGQVRIDMNQLSLDWRFRPTWLLRTLVGDRGSTSLELEWQHWY